MRKRPINLKLKAAIVESGKSFSDIATEIKMPNTTFSRKINGYGEFNESEMEDISKAVNKPVHSIFFNQSVTNTIINTG